MTFYPMYELNWHIIIVYKDGRPHEFYDSKYWPKSDGAFLLFTPRKGRAQMIRLSEIHMCKIDVQWLPYTDIKKD